MQLRHVLLGVKTKPLLQVVQVFLSEQLKQKRGHLMIWPPAIDYPGGQVVQFVEVPEQAIQELSHGWQIVPLKKALGKQV